MVGFFGAKKLIGSKEINPFTARSFYQSTMSPHRYSHGAYNGTTLVLRVMEMRRKGIAVPTRSSSIGIRDGRQTSLWLSSCDDEK